MQPLRQKTKICIDTRHHLTAQKALDIGVDWINDVTGFSSPEMIEAVKDKECKIIIMHSLGIPANRNITISPADDPVQTVFQWAKDKIELLQDSGIDKSRIIFDPGIGFGKSPEQSLVLIQSASNFKLLNVPIFIGHSRKSFIELINPGKEARDRDEETHTISEYLNKKQIDYLRVHDIKGNLKAIRCQK